MTNIWGDRDWYSSRDRPAWERNTVSVVEHLGNPEGFAWAMFQQSRRQVEAWQAEVGPNVPWWLLDKVEEWKGRWLAATYRNK